MKTLGASIRNLLLSATAGTLTGPRAWTNPNDRAAIAKSDEMGELPQSVYSRIVREAEDASFFCESPIEQIALFQMAGRNYAPESECGRFASIAISAPSSLGASDFFIVPQVGMGRHRADFVFFLPYGRKFIVECDGRRFHDRDADFARDYQILVDFNIPTIRVTGRDIWRGASWTNDVVAQVQSMAGWK